MCTNQSGNIRTFQSLEGVLIDVGDGISLQFQRVEQNQMTENACRYLGELIVGQDEGIQIGKTYRPDNKMKDCHF